MLEIIIWFLVILLLVPVLYIAYNYIRTLMPGQGKTYILQPIYRLLKLFEKKDNKNNFLASFFSVGACLFSLVALYMTVAGYNFLFVVSVLSMAESLVITGAFSSNEFAGKVSAQRGISRFMIWLFTSMVAASSIYKVTGTLNIDEIVSFSRSNGLITSLPFTFISLFIILLMKGNMMHFNFGISGNELSFLGAALYTPYSGWSLAIAQLTQWIEIGVWIKILSDFLPLIKSVSLMIISLMYLAFLFLDGFISKVSWKKAARYSWIWAGGLSIVNYICLYYF